jgi:hypothetical protein
MPKDPLDRSLELAQERRDIVNELGLLSKCLAGYIGCFDATKTHADPDAELVKLLEQGCKNALKRLTGYSGAKGCLRVSSDFSGSQTDVWVANKKTKDESFCCPTQPLLYALEVLLFTNSFAVDFPEVPAFNYPDMLIDLRPYIEAVEKAAGARSKKPTEEQKKAMVLSLLQLSAAALLAHEAVRTEEVNPPLTK